jgi:Rhodopirellula transposase.
MAEVKDMAQMVRRTMEKYNRISDSLDELSRRLWAANESLSIGYGGIEIVSRATGISRPTIRNGIIELEGHLYPVGRTRKTGGGRKDLTVKQPDMVLKLKALVGPSIAGNPQSSVLWISRSLRHLEKEMKACGYTVSYKKIGNILHDEGFSLKGNRKTREGKNNPGRNEQFQHISDTATSFLSSDDPVISVDAKKKELIGNFKNNGKEWKPPGNVDEVNVYDFLSDAEGKAIPYGIYDMKANEGYVSIGIDHDTAEFAVESIGRWWKLMGRKRYPDAHRLMIAADGGGSNGSRVKLWKIELQKFADEFHLDITVCHYPPGMSKWNKIEHRMFSYITINWRGKPLRSYETIIELIGNTTTKSGLKISADMDSGLYEKERL